MEDKSIVKITNMREALSDHPDIWSFIKCLTDDNLIVAHGKSEEGAYATFASVESNKLFTFTKTEEGYTVGITETTD